MGGGSHCALDPPTKQKHLQRLSETAVLQVRLSEVRLQIVPGTEDLLKRRLYVAEVCARPTDEKRIRVFMSLCRAKSYRANVGDEAAVVSQVAVNV